MVFREILCALLTGLLLTDFFTVRLLSEKIGPRTGVFLVTTFLASWAGGLWSFPAGPRLWGVYWVPFLASGLIVALPLARALFAYRTSLKIAKETNNNRKIVIWDPVLILLDGISGILILIWYY